MRVKTCTNPVPLYPGARCSGPGLSSRRCVRTAGCAQRLPDGANNEYRSTRTNSGASYGSATTQASSGSPYDGNQGTHQTQGSSSYTNPEASNPYGSAPASQYQTRQLYNQELVNLCLIFNHGSYVSISMRNRQFYIESLIVTKYFVSSRPFYISFCQNRASFHHSLSHFVQLVTFQIL